MEAEKYNHRMKKKNIHMLHLQHSLLNTQMTRIVTTLQMLPQD